MPRTLVILGDFPRYSQTFVYRELLEMLRRGADLRILALHRTSGETPAGLEPLLERASFVGHGWLLEALRAADPRAADLRGALRWIATLPHRTPLHRARAIRMMLAAAALAPRVRRERIELLHAHFAATQTELAMCLSRLTGVPYVATFHAYDIFRDRNVLEEKIRASRRVFTCTAFNREALVRAAPQLEDRVVLSYHGLDLARFGPPRPAPDGPARFVAVGRLVAKKGFDVLIDAAQRLATCDLDFRLDVIGDGPERRTLERAAARTSGRVRFRGVLPLAEVLEAMAGALALVAPSIQDRSGDMDGIPNVVLEALASGRPAIASRISGIPEVVRDGETGLVVPPGDATALAEAMAKLVRAPDEAARLGRAGRALVEERFDVRRNVGAILSAWDQIAVGSE